MQVLSFVIEVLSTLNSELVERGEAKSQEDHEISNRVKDGIREFAIQEIIQVLATNVLGNYTSLPEQMVEKTLNIFA